ncbi:MAG: hypothetical protein KBF27_04985 [Cypionkella sp.]|nr:hypothetical protein [Cypionkella sp.]
MAIIRLAVVGFVILSAVYWIVSVYSRSVRRERLEKRYDAGGIDGERDAYIEAGMQAYEHGLRRRLIWLVYVIPTVVISVTVYLVNYQ